MHETARDLADCLILLVDVIVAGEQESAVAAGTFTGAVVATDHHQVQRVTDTFQIVFLQLSHHSRLVNGQLPTRQPDPAG